METKTTESVIKSVEFLTDWQKQELIKLLPVEVETTKNTLEQFAEDLIYRLIKQHADSLSISERFAIQDVIKEYS